MTLSAKEGTEFLAYVRDDAFKLADKSVSVNEFEQRLKRFGGNNALYYLAFALYFISSALGRSAFADASFVPANALDSILKVLAVSLLFIKFLTQRNSLEGWGVALALGAIGLISWRQSAEGWLFWCGLFIICAKGVDVRRMASLTFILSVAALLIICTSAGLGIIDNIAYVRGDETRWCLGFTHPNVLGLYLLVTCFSFSVLRFGKNPIPDIALILAADALNLSVANSRTCVVLSLVQALLLAIFYWVHGECARRALRLCFVAVITLVIASSLYFMVAYDPSIPLHGMLNSALSGRLRLAHDYYLMQPLTAFGCSFEQFEPIYWEQGLPEEIPKSFVVDNAWCHLVLRYGVIPASMFLAGNFATLSKMLRDRRWDAVLFGFVLMTIYGFCETTGIRIECNFLLFVMGTELLYSSDAKDRARCFVARLRRKK